MDDDDDLILVESTRARLESRLLCKDIMLAESRQIGDAIADSIKHHSSTLSGEEGEAEVERMRRCVADVHFQASATLAGNMNAALSWEQLSSKLSEHLGDVQKQEREAMESSRELTASAHEHMLELKQALSDLEQDCMHMQTRLGKQTPTHQKQDTVNIIAPLWPKRGHLKMLSSFWLVGYRRRYIELDREDGKAVLRYASDDNEIHVLSQKIYLEDSPELIVHRDRWVLIHTKQKKYDLDCGDDVEAEAWYCALRQCAHHFG